MVANCLNSAFGALQSCASYVYSPVKNLLSTINKYRDALLVPAGSLAAAFGGRALLNQISEGSYGMFDTSGAATVLAMGVAAAAQGVSACQDMRTAHQKAAAESQRRSEERRKTAKLNEELSRLPGSAQAETVLVMIDAEDHNGALEITRHFCRNLKDIGNQINVRCVYMEKPEDFDEACDELEAQGKTLSHVVVSAHGTWEKVQLAGEDIAGYLADLDKLKSCVLISCFGGTVGGAAERLANSHPRLTIYGPATTILKSNWELFLSQGELGMFAFSDASKHPVTQVYREGLRCDPVRIEKLPVAEFPYVEAAAVNFLSHRMHIDQDAARQFGRMYKQSQISELNRQLAQEPGIDPQNRVLLLASKDHWRAYDAIQIDKLQEMYPGALLQYAYIENAADIDEAIQKASESGARCRVVALCHEPTSSIRMGEVNVQEYFNRYQIEGCEYLSTVPELSAADQAGDLAP